MHIIIELSLPVSLPRAQLLRPASSQIHKDPTEQNDRIRIPCSSQKQRFREGSQAYTESGFLFPCLNLPLSLLGFSQGAWISFHFRLYLNSISREGSTHPQLSSSPTPVGRNDELQRRSLQSDRIPELWQRGNSFCKLSAWRWVSALLPSPLPNGLQESGIPGNHPLKLLCNRRGAGAWWPGDRPHAHICEGMKRLPSSNCPNLKGLCSRKLSLFELEP